MFGLTLHSLSESWLRTLQQSSPAADCHDASRSRAAIRQIQQATDVYLASKNIKSSQKRDACLQRLMSLAEARGLAPLAQRICIPRLAHTGSGALPPATPQKPAVPLANLYAAMEARASFACDALLLGALAAARVYLPMAPELIALAEVLTQPQGAELATKLLQMRRADQADNTMEGSHVLLELLAAALPQRIVSDAVINALATVLERRVTAYLDSPHAMLGDATWTQARNLLYDQRHLAALAAQHGSGLRPIMYWTPDVSNIGYYRVILVSCPGANKTASPATFRTLRFLMRMEGPAKRLWMHNPMTLRLQPMGHPNCTCVSQKEHAASSLKEPGRMVIVTLAKDIEAIVHGNFVPRIGPFLRTAADEMARGIRMVYSAGFERGNWSLLQGLFDAWKPQACIDGKLNTVDAYLTEERLHDLPDLEMLVDLDEKVTDNDRCGEYLRVFRRKAARAYAAATGVDERDVARIQSDPLFARRYCNDRTFGAYLSITEFAQGKKPRKLRALLDYQVDVLCTLERAG